MDTIDIEIEKIIPYKNNPRINDKAVDAVAASIKKFGFRQPIVVDKNMVVIVGHTRLKAAIKLKRETVPCVIADMSEEDANAYRLADNKTNELSGWNFDMLAAEIKNLSSIDMSQFGFDMSKFEEVKDAVDDGYEINLPEESKSKTGEVWMLGAHKVMCGDATNPDDVKNLFGGGGLTADLYLTDPPYNVDYTGCTKEKLKIENDHMEDKDFRQFLCDSFAAAKSVMKPGAAFYIWHADSEGYNFRGACHDIGWQVRECLIWVKNALVMGRQDYQWQHEPCLYGWNEGTHRWYSDRSQTTTLHFDRPHRNKEHPTMKPIPLFDYLIKNSTKQGDIVFDSFGGSGTTIMACEQNGRIGYCMELDPKYVDVIIERWEKFTGKKAKLISNMVSDEKDDVEK